MLLEPLGPATLFLLNGISFFAMLEALKALRDVPSRGGAAAGSLASSMLAGLAYVRRDRMLRGLLTLFALTAILGRSHQGLLPIFARDLWHGGPRGYGLLLSSSGAGALVGAFGLASLTEMKRKGRVLIASGLAFSGALVLFALSTSLPVGSLFLFVGGVAATVFGSLVATFIQLATPNELRGRVMSLYTVAMIGLPSLGALSSGAIAELLGGLAAAPRAVLFGASGMGASVIAFAPLLWRQGESSTFEDRHAAAGEDGVHAVESTSV